jgi:uncharacterized protein (TIGR02147 family)
MVKTKKISFFAHLDYKALVLFLLENTAEGPHGRRKRLAEALGCQVSFLSQVLAGDKHFNLEQIEKVARYFNLSEAEEDYLFDLLSYNRAGSVHLKQKLLRRINRIREEQDSLKNKLREKHTLSKADQSVYYSSWAYAAIHMACTIPSLQTFDSLMQALKLSREQISTVAKFLTGKQIVEIRDGKIIPLQQNVFIGKDSPLVAKHHLNLRSKLIGEVAFEKPEDLTYSLFFSASREDLPRIKALLVDAIADCLAVIRPTKEERLGAIAIDLKTF